MRHQVNRYGLPFSTVIFITGLTLPVVAQAYVGPGAGLSLLAALWGLVVAIGVAVIFFIMWPIRRMRRRKAAEQAAASQASSEPVPDAAPLPVQQTTDARTAPADESKSPPPGN